MKVLVAVYSHTGDSVNGNHQKIRETWGGHLAPWDLRFMIGHRDAPGWKAVSDEVLLPERANRACGADWLLWNLYYQELTIEMLRWSLEQGYDFTFLCCNDTFVVPSKLKTTDFVKYDYSGVFYPPPPSTVHRWERLSMNPSISAQLMQRRMRALGGS